MTPCTRPLLGSTSASTARDAAHSPTHSPDTCDGARYRQQDAQELLRFLLDAIDMEERKRLKRLQHRAVRRELEARAAAAEEAARAQMEAQAAAEAAAGAGASAGAEGGDVPPPPALVKNVSYFLGPGASKRVLVRATPASCCAGAPCPALPLLRAASEPPAHRRRATHASPSPVSPCPGR